GPPVRRVPLPPHGGSRAAPPGTARRENTRTYSQRQGRTMLLNQPSASAAVATGSCPHFGYEADYHWAQLPPGWTWNEVAAVAADSRDRVFVFNRGDHPLLIFHRDGTFLGSWGEGLFVRPHGLWIGPDDSVYCTDDLDHTVRKFTPDGQLLLTLGVRGKPSDTGVTP